MVRGLYVLSCFYKRTNAQVSKFSREKFRKIGKEFGIYVNHNCLVCNGYLAWSKLEHHRLGTLNCLVIVSCQGIRTLLVSHKFNIREKFLFKLFGRTFMLMSAIRILDCYRKFCNLRMMVDIYEMEDEVFNGIDARLISTTTLSLFLV